MKWNKPFILDDLAGNILNFKFKLIRNPGKLNAWTKSVDFLFLNILKLTKCLKTKCIFMKSFPFIFLSKFISYFFHYFLIHFSIFYIIQTKNKKKQKKSKKVFSWCTWPCSTSTTFISKENWTTWIMSQSFYCLSWLFSTYSWWHFMVDYILILIFSNFILNFF